MMRSFIGALLACWSLSVFADPQALKAQLQDYYFDAARRGDVEMLKTFIESGYSLNTVDDKGYTALILSAYHGHEPAVEQLLAAGADACVQDKRGNTALMGAIFKGELRIARRLLGTACNPRPTQRRRTDGGHVCRAVQARRTARCAQGPGRRPECRRPAGQQRYTIGQR